jgi:hypothetical protein
MDDSSPPRIGHSTNRIYAAWRFCAEYALRAPLRFSLLVVLALLATSVAVLRIGYDTIDDVLLTMVVSGRGLSAVPDEHLVFSNILLGQALKWLYQTWSQFPWYGSYLLLVHYFSLVATLYCALGIERESAPGDVINDSMRRSFRRRFAAFLVCFLIAELVLLNSLQFTSTAFLAAQAGIFLMFLAVRRRTLRPQSLPLGPLCAAALLMVAAGLIRLENLGLALLVASPLITYLALHASRQALLPAAASTGFALLLALAAARYNSAYYEADPAWKGFYEFNQLRCKFNDYQWTSYTPETANVFSAVGWSKNDHEILAHWYFDDPSLYSEANFRAVLAAYPWKTSRLTPGYFVQVFNRPLRDHAVWAVMLALPFLLVGLGDTRHARPTILVSVLLALSLVLLVGVNNKVPPVRIYFPLLAFPLFATLLFPVTHSALSIPVKIRSGIRQMFADWAQQPRLTWAVVAMLVVGTAMSLDKQCRRAMRRESERPALQAFLNEANAQPQKLYVSWEAALPLQLVSPFDNLSSWSKISLLSLAWPQRTPWQEDFKRRFGVSDVARALYERDDIVLIATDTHKSLFTTFAKEHFNADVAFVPFRQYSDALVAGSFRPQVAPGSTADRRIDTTPR